MIKVTRFTFALLLVMAMAPGALAMKTGDPAPPLGITNWIKAGPITLAEGKGKNFYVVEFWATYCPGCRMSIPHLTDLQKKYKDKGLVVIGVSEEDPETVQSFVKEQGAKMDYAVAVDAHLQAYRAYMSAFGYDTIPTAFVVDKEGRLVWHGPPFASIMERVIARIADGTFDLAALQKEQQEFKEKQTHFRQYFSIVSQSSDKAKAATEADWLMERGKDDPILLYSLAVNILTDDTLKYQDKDLAMRAARQAYEITKGKDARALHVYALALFDAGKVDDAIKYQRQAVQVNTDKNLAEFFKNTLDKFESAKTASKS